jgi:FMNH2-dependent dimethyl sulfone monooxygenase
MMRFGVWTPLPHTIRPEPVMEAAIAELQTPGVPGVDASFQFAVDVVQKAEACGFETTLIAERLLGPDLEAWILSAALATQTKTIEIMPAIHPGIVTPQMVAKMGATLDRISGGRLAINIVNGWWEEEFNLFGNGTWLAKEDDRYRRMDEYLTVMKGLWTEDTFSHPGKFYNVQAGAVPTRTMQRPHPPIYTGSRSGSAKDIVARQCDVWFVAVQPGYRQYEEHLKDTVADIAEMEKLSRSYGRKMRYGISCHVVCDDSMEVARQQADELEEFGQKNHLASIVSKALGAGLVGSPELIAERIQRYEDIGIECLMLHFHPMLEGLQTIADKIMPLVRRGASNTRTGDRRVAGF